MFVNIYCDIVQNKPFAGCATAPITVNNINNNGEEIVFFGNSYNSTVSIYNLSSNQFRYLSDIENYYVGCGRDRCIFKSNNPRDKNEPEYIIFDGNHVALYTHGINKQTIHKLQLDYKNDENEENEENDEKNSNVAKNKNYPKHNAPFPIPFASCLALTNINCMLYCISTKFCFRIFLLCLFDVFCDYVRTMALPFFFRCFRFYHV